MTGLTQPELRQPQCWFVHVWIIRSMELVLGHALAADRSLSDIEFVSKQDEAYVKTCLEQELLAAGWSPGRTVDTSGWQVILQNDGFELHEAALKFWAEYGGLKVTQCCSGVTSAREPFELDPTLAVGEADRFASWSRKLGQVLVPIGELDQGRFFLGIDERAGLYLVADWLGFFGEARRGLEALFLGYSSDEVDLEGKSPPPSNI